MYRVLRVLVFSAALVIGTINMSGCANDGAQNIAPPGYGTYSCVPGQACVTSCLPGQVGCSSVTGYVHFDGNLASINSSVAKSMIAAFFGVYNWCLGGCYNTSTVDVVLNNGTANVTINLGGYPIAGTGTYTPINNNIGSDIEVIPFGPGARIDLISNNMLLDGSISAVPSVQVEYNGQVLGTTSLLRQAY